MKESTINKMFLVVTALLSTCHQCSAFVHPTFGIRRTSTTTTTTTAFTSLMEGSNDVSSDPAYDHENTAIQAPLKFLGPYPAIGLRFPNLATAAQRAKNISGIALDFVLDTAANVNTLNGQVAQELQLEIVGEALPGVGSAGSISGGVTYELGDTQLERGRILPSPTSNEHESFLFMQNLTASALPVASPASAGLLSLAFFYCFEGGVEFHWGSSGQLKDGLMEDMPAVTFFAKKDSLAEDSIKGLTKVKIESIPITQLPSILININGVQIQALLDTGSPITVLNSQAAKQAGIETISLPTPSKDSGNPFAAVANRFKEAQALAKAAAEGNVLTIAGMNGPVNLLKSTESIHISAISDDDSNVSFGQGHVFVGDIPGLAALNGIGVDAPPAVVLGMDVLRRKPKMILRAQDNEVYF